MKTDKVRTTDANKYFTLSKRLGLFSALTAGLLLTAGCARDESAKHGTPPPTHSESENSERQVHHNPPSPPNAAVENTRRNARDKDGVNLTADDQKENRTDRELTAAIRRAVVKDKSLSLNAHNAKIITRDGVVTLRGPVENQAEKNKLQSIAEHKRGVKQVNNQLEPKTP